MEKQTLQGYFLKLARERLQHRLGQFERLTADLETGDTLARELDGRFPMMQIGYVSSTDKWHQLDKGLLSLIDDWSASRPEARAVAPLPPIAEPEGVLIKALTPAKEPDWHLMATPAELCKAFYAFTGMDKHWFDNLNDAPKLKAARFLPGQGGRNNREPLFYVYEVFQWLIDKKRRKGKPMSTGTGWRMLKVHFPMVYKVHERSAPGTE